MVRELSRSFPLSHHVWGIGGDNVGLIQSTKTPKHQVYALRVYLADEGEAAEQQEMPLDAFNAPRERCDKILASLVRSQASGVSVPRVGRAASLDLAKCVHDEQFVDFLSTAWECRQSPHPSGGLISRTSTAIGNRHSSTPRKTSPVVPAST